MSVRDILRNTQTILINLAEVGTHSNYVNVCVGVCVCVCQCLKHLVDMNYATEGRCDNSYLYADIEIKKF